MRQSSVTSVINDMALTPIEIRLAYLLVEQVKIEGTAQVGYALWPDKEMRAQGAALAAGRVLRMLENKGMVHASVGMPTTWHATAACRIFVASQNQQRR